MDLVYGLCRAETASPPNASKLSSLAGLPIPWMMFAVVAGLSPLVAEGTDVRGVV